MNATRIQGVLVDVDGVGVLIRGPSGCGKSLAALSLMDRGHRLVSDDLVEVREGPDGVPVGRALEEDVRIEVRGLGIFSAKSLFPEGTVPSFPINLVVELDVFDPVRDTGRTLPEFVSTSILGQELLQIRVPVARGMNPALLIELVARQFRLKRAGEGQ
jgi:HPr kinase/phosphorylase